MTATRRAVAGHIGSTQRPMLSRRVLVMLLTATFMAQFDFFVVNVAAPSIRQALNASESALELIVGGYAFAYASALVLGGRLGDLYGRRRLFVLGMLGFTVASALCGTAGSSGELIAARLGQGLAAALMLPQVLAVISAAGDTSERPRAMAWYGVAAGLGSIAGQVLGGLLVTVNVAGLGWRLIFLVNVPIGAVGSALAARIVPEPPRPPRAKRAVLDPVGALGLALASALALVPLTMGRTSGWPWWTWVSMALAAPVFATTVRWQHLLRERGGQPLLELSLFRAPSFRYGLIANFAFMAGFASYMFTLALLLQVGLGFDAFRAGLAFAPAGVGFSLSALLAPRVARRYGQLAMVAGAVTAAAGLAALGGIAALGGDRALVGWIVVATVVISLGNGLVLPSLIGAALRDVPAQHAGAGAGALTTGQQFASAAGVAGVGTLYFATAGTDQGTGMAWSAGAGALLMLAIAALVLASRHQSRGGV